jgi:tetratricopeptide (TPR) repeat protein
VSEDYLATGAEAGPDASARLLDAEIALRLDDFAHAQRLYAAALSEAASDRERSAAHEGLANVSLRTGEPAEAIASFERALAADGREPCDRPSLAENLGRAYATLGDLPPAIALFEQCARRYEEKGDTVRYVRFASLLGYALTDNGELERAEQVVGKALSAGRRLRDPYTRARLFWSQSRLRLEQGEPEQAVRYARDALQTLKTTEDTYFLGLTHQLLAHAYLDAGRGDDALELLEEGWPLVSAAATPIELAHYDIEKARALAATGEKDKAGALAMDVTRRLGDAQPVDIGRVYVLLGEIFADVGEPARAREFYELAVELLEEQPPSRYLVEAYRNLAGLHEREGRSDEAVALLKRALAVQELATRR